MTASAVATRRVERCRSCSSSRVRCDREPRFTEGSGSSQAARFVEMRSTTKRTGRTLTRAPKTPTRHRRGARIQPEISPFVDAATRRARSRSLRHGVRRKRYRSAHAVNTHRRWTECGVASRGRRAGNDTVLSHRARRQALERRSHTSVNVIGSKLSLTYSMRPITDVSADGASTVCSVAPSLHALRARGNPQEA